MYTLSIINNWEIIKSAKSNSLSRLSEFAGLNLQDYKYKFSKNSLTTFVHKKNPQIKLFIWAL